MPARRDIRLDLLLILPLLLIVVPARLVLLRRARLSAGARAASRAARSLNLPAVGEIFAHPVPNARSMSIRPRDSKIVGINPDQISYANLTIC